MMDVLKEFIEIMSIRCAHQGVYKSNSLFSFYPEGGEKNDPDSLEVVYTFLSK